MSINGECEACRSEEERLRCPTLGKVCKLCHEGGGCAARLIVGMVRLLKEKRVFVPISLVLDIQDYLSDYDCVKQTKQTDDEFITEEEEKCDSCGGKNFIVIDHADDRPYPHIEYCDHAGEKSDDDEALQRAVAWLLENR